MREAQARRDLERYGCPPCHPPDVDVPMLRYLQQDPPEGCRTIVDYWASFTSTSDMPLFAQAESWRRFRVSQYHARRSFQDYEHEFHQRRQRHGLDVHPPLTMDLELQSPLQRWAEFQNYQLARLERMEKTRDELEEKLSKPHPADHMAAFRANLGYCTRDIQRHMVLLGWIEQTRAVIEPGGTAAASRRASARLRRTRETHPHPVIDRRARISKPEINKRKPRQQRQSGPKTAAPKDWRGEGQGQVQRRPTRQVPSMPEGSRRRSTRIAALPRKNYKV